MGPKAMKMRSSTTDETPKLKALDFSDAPKDNAPVGVLFKYLLKQLTVLNDNFTSLAVSTDYSATIAAEAVQQVSTINRTVTTLNQTVADLTRTNKYLVSENKKLEEKLIKLECY